MDLNVKLKKETSGAITILIEGIEIVQFNNTGTIFIDETVSQYRQGLTNHQGGVSGESINWRKILRRNGVEVP